MSENVEVEVADVPSAPTAVREGRAAPGELSATIRRLLDPVWAYVRTTDLVPLHNIVLYRPPDGEPGMPLEVGVRVDRAFDDAAPPADVCCRELPAGRVARATHVGRYERLGQTHDAVVAFCHANGLERTGRSWEIYGDWNEDVDLLETEVVHEVRPLRDPPS
ncbi:MAG TPA: GyrI-like domain-containing protein [Acidimicrobiales bacterium]|nr:GyrI-like domain-containing protein [Acidimicrobiales bacterium]